MASLRGLKIQQINLVTVVFRYSCAKNTEREMPNDVVFKTSRITLVLMANLHIRCGFLIVGLFLSKYGYFFHITTPIAAYIMQ